MLAIDRPGIRRRAAQSGLAAMEFAMVSVVFFIAVFGVIELGRLVYVFNTLQEVTRRAASAAANTNPADTSAMDQVRQQAIFRNSAGMLALADPVSDQHVRIDYLQLSRDASGVHMTAIPATSIPSCPAANHKACLTDPNGASCVRLVRVRICDPANMADCDPVRYKPLVSLINLPINIPTSTTIVTAETLGYTPGSGACP